MPLCVEVVNGLLNRGFKNVITQQNSNLAATGEPFCQREGMRDAFGFLLHAIREFTPEIISTAQNPHEVSDVLRIRHNKDIGDTCSRELFDTMKHHRFVAYRQEVLTGNFSEWMQTDTESPCENYAF